MSHPVPSKSSESKPAEDGYSSASSPCPRSFLSLEHEVRTDIKCLVEDKVSQVFDVQDEPNTGLRHNEPPEIWRTPADELQSLALEFVACVSHERRCTSHRMRLALQDPLAPGVILDTPGTGLFFYRLWERVIEEATRPDRRQNSKEKSCATASDWETLAAERAELDQRTDRAVKLIGLAQEIKCDTAASWNVWGRSGRWSDLPLLEHLVRDREFAIPDAIAHHENISDPRIQRYVCGATLPTAKHAKKGEVRELLEMRWKWLQLQRFGAHLWNKNGRVEYFTHAMRALDALVTFAPQDPALPGSPNVAPTTLGGEDSDSEAINGESNCETCEGIGEALIANQKTVEVEYDESYQVPKPSESIYGPREHWIEWSEPPPALPPTFLQLLLAEGAAIWIYEATPVIRRYIERNPRTESERAWFECAQESEAERNERWRRWKQSLEKVRDWCMDGNSGVARESTVINSVARALDAMTRAEGNSGSGVKYVPESAPHMVSPTRYLSCSA
ncbi:hypothetical protein RhiJN_18747 [Ceratobasidium sp. AG-Ba]|nr:hypothetical protein RhiJN_18747 [Ceratobasidium sp. AG-Ba]